MIIGGQQTGLVGSFDVVASLCPAAWTRGWLAGLEARARTLVQTAPASRLQLRTVSLGNELVVAQSSSTARGEVRRRRKGAHGCVQTWSALTH